MEPAVHGVRGLSPARITPFARDLSGMNPPTPEMRLNLAAFVRLRQRAGLSGKALAARAGVSQSYLSELETGKKDASPAVIVKLAGALDVPVDTIVEWR